MAEVVRFRKGARMDKRIEEFCKGSSELLASIHSRCGASGKNDHPDRLWQKRKRKPGARSN